MNKKTADPASSVFPSDDAIRKILVDRIDIRRQGISIVVGVVDRNGRRIIAYGKPAKSDQPLDGDSVFEIGSITKLFTKLLLSEMVHRGEVTLDDPAAKYLPPTVTMPERNGRVITLFDLATHTSGLPRVPGNIDPYHPGNPYDSYSVEKLYQFLSSYSLTREIGSEREYSNLGVGLLGHALARRAGTDYESLLLSRICLPLGMDDTRITLTPEMKSRLMAGHDPGLSPIDNWNFGVLAGAGGLRSTANDLLTFLSAYFGLTRSPLEPAMDAARMKMNLPIGQEDMEVSLGWGFLKRNNKEIALHTGGTGGYRSLAAFETGTGAGVVVLSNAAWDVFDIGLHLLDDSSPLAKPPSEHIEVKVDTGLYDYYVGNYQLDPEFAITVSREGGHLFTHGPGFARYEIFPESEREFFYRVMDMQITFVTGDKGYATELILHQDGEDIHIKRVG